MLTGGLQVEVVLRRPITRRPTDLHNSFSTQNKGVCSLRSLRLCERSLLFLLLPMNYGRQMCIRDSSAPSAPSGFDFCLSQRLSVSAVNILWRVSLCLYGGLILPATHAAAQDAREIVRRAIELDRNNWIQRADYTWACLLYTSRCV